MVIRKYDKNKNINEFLDDTNINEDDTIEFSGAHHTKKDMRIRFRCRQCHRLGDTKKKCRKSCDMQ